MESTSVSDKLMSSEDLSDILTKDPNAKFLIVPVTKSADVPVTKSTETFVPILSEKDSILALIEQFKDLPINKKILEKNISEHITLESIFKLWNLSICTNSQILKKACINFFYKNHSVLNTDKIIEQITPSVILSISKSNDTNLEEHEIFTLVHKWIELRKPLDSTVKELISYIRLPLMSPTFLAKTVEPSGLFCERDLYEAYKHHAYPEPRVELKFQNRVNQIEIFIGPCTSTFNDYRKIVNADIKSDMFRKHLIKCAKKNGDRFKYIGNPVDKTYSIGLMTDSNIITIGTTGIICITKIENNEWVTLESNDLQGIYDEKCVLDIGSSSTKDHRYSSFFVKKNITFD